MTAYNPQLVRKEPQSGLAKKILITGTMLSVLVGLAGVGYKAYSESIKERDKELNYLFNEGIPQIIRNAGEAVDDIRGINDPENKSDY